MKWYLLFLPLLLLSCQERTLVVNQMPDSFAYTWDDVVSPVVSAKLGANAPTFDENIRSYSFANEANENSEDYIFVGVQLPHGYRQGSNISCHLHLLSSSSVRGDVVFAMNYTWTNIGAVQQTGTYLTAKTEPSDTIGRHVILDFPDFDGTNKTISSSLKATIRRKSSATEDNYEAPVYLDFFDCHFQRDSTGSRGEYTK